MDFRPSFFRQSPLFWPIAEAARTLEGSSAWPTADELTQKLQLPPPLRFETAQPSPRRMKAPPRPSERYDARIALSHAIPTRPRSWHDLLNALVWATFPMAKQALHARQHRLIAKQLGPDMRVPGARTKEQDAIAMLDEGGVVVAHLPEATETDVAEIMADGSAGNEFALARLVVFGHAIYESCVQAESGVVRAQAYRLSVTDIASDEVLLLSVERGLVSLLERAEPLSRDCFGTAVVRWGASGDARSVPLPAPCGV